MKKLTNYCMSCGTANEYGAKTCSKCNSEFGKSPTPAKDSKTTIKTNTYSKKSQIQELMAKIQPIDESEIIIEKDSETISFGELMDQSKKKASRKKKN